MSRRPKRRQSYPGPVPTPRGSGWRGTPYSFGNTFERADYMRNKLLDEAQTLCALHNPLGEQLRDLALALPMSSLERMNKG